MIKLNDFVVKATMFPDKTSQVWNIPAGAFKPHNVIEWQFEYEGEFMHVAQLRHLIGSRLQTAELYLPYLPYGRQDKPASNTATFACNTFCMLLNSLQFFKVKIFDPHNEKMLQDVLQHWEFISPILAIESAIDNCKPDAIVYPDSGAQKRYSINMPAVVCSKVRNPQTGEIAGMEVSGEYQGKSLLIVDDICDGGATFIKLAALLTGAKEVNLYVSHGLFTRGTEVLRQSGINRIFTKEGEYHASNAFG